jgi:hypothetical protein
MALTSLEFEWLLVDTRTSAAGIGQSAFNTGTEIVKA